MHPFPVWGMVPKTQEVAIMATAFEISRLLIGQGADAGNMAHVLESLSNADQTPVWGPGAVGAHLTPDEAAVIIIGATAAAPEQAAAHVAKASEMVRHDGRSLGQVLTEILAAEPHEIYASEMSIGLQGTQARIRYQRGLSDVFSVNGGLSAFCPSAIIRGSLLQAVAMKLSRPTTGGWKEAADEHEGSTAAEKGTD